MSFQKYLGCLAGGPMVWLLEGPVPMRYSSLIDFILLMGYWIICLSGIVNIVTLQFSVARFLNFN